MNDLKVLAKQAKQRLKTNFWQGVKKDVDESASAAAEMGLNESKVRGRLYGKVKSSIKGEERDEFYEKVKSLLDEYGEVSDAIGRLTDREYFATLSYEERQRYTLELSTKYLNALEKYKREKEITF
jgi:hypothetical protein